MSLKSAYKILPEYHLIIELHKGEIDIDSYIQFKQTLINDNKFKSGYNYFIDFKNVAFLNNIDNLYKLRDFINKISNNVGNRKIAIIAKTPNQTVSPLMFKTFKNSFSKDIEIFSTNSKAINWATQKNVTKIPIEKILSELSQCI